MANKPSPPVLVGQRIRAVRAATVAEQSNLQAARGWADISKPGPVIIELDDGTLLAAEAPSGKPGQLVLVTPSPAPGEYGVGHPVTPSRMQVDG